MLVFCDFSHEAISSAGNAVARIEQRSAMNPMLWLTGILVPCFLIAAYAFMEQTEIFHLCVYAALGVAGIAVLVYVYLLLAKPEKLQSEEFQLKQAAINYCERTQSAPEKMIAVLQTNPSLTEK